MRDLTQGPILRHQVAIAIPIAIGMIFQTLYYFVDLYFVAQLGEHPVAGVSAAGNSYFAIFALSQLLGVGTAALIAHAVGRKDQADANLVFNQALGIATVLAALTVLGVYCLSDLYLRTVSADAQTPGRVDVAAVVLSTRVHLVLVGGRHGLAGALQLGLAARRVPAKARLVAASIFRIASVLFIFRRTGVPVRQLEQRIAIRLKVDFASAERACRCEQQDRATKLKILPNVHR